MQATRVLVVDDDADDRELTQRTFRQAPGIAAVYAKSGAEALSVAAKAPFDVILLDYRLPDWEGVRLCQELRARGVRARVFLVTGAASETLVSRALEAGVERVVAKSGSYLQRLAAELAQEASVP